jgi:hypothetical protein
MGLRAFQFFKTMQPARVRQENQHRQPTPVQAHTKADLSIRERRSNIEPAIKSWIDNVIVPALVRKWIASGTRGEPTNGLE